uniref:LijF n=1 Tax=Ascomycota sp. F53 TaxID=1168013 RepID=A0A140CZC2_9ASCO|nr:lijF [Ascomycota sp. F53]
MAHSIRSYEVEIKPFTRKQFPNLPPTRQVGYDGMMPGPTFQTMQGREAIVRFINHGDRADSVHLHGSFSRSPFDGWADDATEIGQYKDYYWPNRQNARTLWYHDHVADHTAENVYQGQAGFYILHDTEEMSKGLPSGKYDIPLGIMARSYNPDGSLWSPEAHNEDVSLYGDVIEVNGQPWPFLAVEPRKYRFRLLDLGISRTFILYLQADQQNSKTVPFTIVGSDAGLLQRPVVSEDVTISVAERWDVVIDFSTFAGQNITMRNKRGIAADTDYPATDRVMRFVVGKSVSDNSNNGVVPNPLRQIAFPPNKAVTTRDFTFDLKDEKWVINGVGWHDVSERILATPKRGSIEIWNFHNAGDWSHPVHVHLIDFQVIKRTGSARSVLPYEAAAQQDVVWLGPRETVTIIARFSPWPGLYMFHCHNLIHEDHEMLDAINVTQVQIPGLKETNLFIDPMDPKYRPKSFPPAQLASRSGDFSKQAIQKKVEWFASLNAYADVDEVEAKLEAYWNNKYTKGRRHGRKHQAEYVKRRRALEGLGTVEDDEMMS